MKCKFSFLVFFLTIWHLSILAEPLENSLENSKVTLLLPINWSSSSHIDLSVEIPENYVPLQPFDDWENLELIEFVPQGENGDNWSEIITVHKLRGRRISAIHLANLLKGQFIKSSKATILFEDSSKEGYETATLFLKYPNEDKTEVIGAKYFSGPYDCEGVQYTIRLSSQQSITEVTQKINNFFTKNLRVINQ